MSTYNAKTSPGKKDEKKTATCTRKSINMINDELRIKKAIFVVLFPLIKFIF